MLWAIIMISHWQWEASEGFIIWNDKFLEAFIICITQTHLFYANNISKGDYMNITIYNVYWSMEGKCYKARKEYIVDCTPSSCNNDGADENALGTN